MIDNSDFMETDIPLEVPVPEGQFLPVSFRRMYFCWNNPLLYLKCNNASNRSKASIRTRAQQRVYFSAM